MPNGSTLRVMIVEDQGAIRQLIHSSLLRIGCHNIVECSDGEEALRVLAKCRAELVISDLNMPKLDGLGLLRAIRSEPRLEKTPFILLTSHSETSIVMKAVELKVNNYLVKPFTVTALKAKIEEVVGPLT